MSRKPIRDSRGNLQPEYYTPRPHLDQAIIRSVSPSARTRGGSSHGHSAAPPSPYQSYAPPSHQGYEPFQYQTYEPPQHSRPHGVSYGRSPLIRTVSPSSSGGSSYHAPQSPAYRPTRPPAPRRHRGRSPPASSRHIQLSAPSPESPPSRHRSNRRTSSSSSGSGSSSDSNPSSYRRPHFLNRLDRPSTSSSSSRRPESSSSSNRFASSTRPSSPPSTSSSRRPAWLDNLSSSFDDLSFSSPTSSRPSSPSRSTTSRAARPCTSSNSSASREQHKPYYTHTISSVRFDIENPSTTWPIPAATQEKIINAVRAKGVEKIGPGEFTIQAEGQEYSVRRLRGAGDDEGRPGTGRRDAEKKDRKKEGRGRKEGGEKKRAKGKDEGKDNKRRGWGGGGWW